MATNNAVNTSLSGQSGTGNFAGTTSPTFVTPTLGAASATSVTFSSTTGIVGTTTNNSADAGSVGEFISSNIGVGSAVSLTSTVTANLTSISLTAGDWDVGGFGITSAGGGTITSNLSFQISNTSATFISSGPTAPVVAFTGNPSTAGATFGLTLSTARISLSSTTTIYLVANSTFSVSTLAVYGFIAARRVR
jgi:hypothetical protein